MSMFEFAGHQLDLQQGRLHKGGQDVRLRPKSPRLLTYLLENSGRVVTKDELVSAVWPNVAVTDGSLSQCMTDIRRTLGEGAASSFAPFHAAVMPWTRSSCCAARLRHRPRGSVRRGGPRSRFFRSRSRCPAVGTRGLPTALSRTSSLPWRRFPISLSHRRT